MVNVLHFLFLLCLIFLSNLSTVMSLRLKMIHRDSIHSPLYPGNLTGEEKLQRLDNYSMATTQFYKIMLSQSDYNTEQLRPQVIHNSFHYVVEFTVGSPRYRPPQRPPRRSYKFVLDTGSRLTWLPCKPCQNYQRHEQHLFDAEDSVSFVAIKCDHPLCDLSQPGWACIQNRCHYTYTYVMSKAVIGALGSELFGFSSNPNPTEFINHLVFGCTHQIQGNFDMAEDVDGILGFNPLPLSLISQIQQNVGGHQFAYCLTFLSPSPLLLGHEASLRGPNVKTIRIGWLPTVGRVYLPLLDVSVGDIRINFAPGTFEPRKVGNHVRGGFFIDSGSVVTYLMSGGPYERVMGAFINYFEHHSVQYAGKNSGLDLCYHNSGLSDFPQMVLHFDGGDFIVDPANVILLVEDDMFCVAIRQMAGLSLLGAYQQKNHWISFDYTRRTLSYSPTDCSLVCA